MSLGQSRRNDTVALDAETLEDLYNIKSSKRKWGLEVEVYNDPTPANNGTWVLVFGLASEDKNDNDNWQQQSEVDAALAAWNNGTSTFNAAINQGVVFCQGSGSPVGSAVCMVLVAVAGANIYQHAIVISGGGTPGNIYYRVSSNSGSSWGAWSLVNS